MRACIGCAAAPSPMTKVCVSHGQRAGQINGGSDDVPHGPRSAIRRAAVVRLVAVPRVVSPRRPLAVAHVVLAVVGHEALGVRHAHESEVGAVFQREAVCYGQCRSAT